MKRKLLQAFCVLLCVLLLVGGCSPSSPVGGTPDSEAQAQQAASDGFALYQEATQNQIRKAQLNQRTEGTVEFTENGTTHSLAFTIDLQLSGDPTAPLLAKKVSYSRDETQFSYTVYDREGTRYYSDDTQKYYEPVSADKTNHEAGRVQLPDMTFAAFEQTVLTEKEKSSSVELTVEGERLEDVLLAEDGLLKALLGDSLQTDESSYLDPVRVEFTVSSDGLFEAYSMSYTVHREVEGEDAPIEVSVISFIRQPGKAVTIEFPDFSEYVNKADLPGNTMDGDALAALTAVLEMLFDEEGKRVTNFGERYDALCIIYGEDALNAAITWYETYLQESPGEVG